jgi:hypothetical protein
MSPTPEIFVVIAPAKCALHVGDVVEATYQIHMTPRFCLGMGIVIDDYDTHQTDNYQVIGLSSKTRKFFPMRAIAKVFAPSEIQLSAIGNAVNSEHCLYYLEPGLREKADAALEKRLSQSQAPT